MCVCVCVCLREREREGQRSEEKGAHVYVGLKSDIDIKARSHFNLFPYLSGEQFCGKKLT